MFLVKASHIINWGAGLLASPSNCDLEKDFGLRHMNIIIELKQNAQDKVCICLIFLVLPVSNFLMGADISLIVTLKKAIRQVA